MTEQIDNLVEQYESRRISRRQLVASLSAIVAAGGRTSAQAPPASMLAQGRSLNHASLAVTDVQKATDFYSALFNIKVVSRPGNGGLNLGLGDGFLGLYQLSNPGTINHICIGVDNYDPDALARAEAGVFDMDRMQLFSSNYQKAGGKVSLSDYYTAAYGGAAFDKSLRERVVFSDHSLVTDEVFGEMQFISCRNVLIYFDRDLQNRVIGLFDESLSRKGFLGLGSKETLRFTDYAHAFDEFAREDKIYQKRGLAT